MSWKDDKGFGFIASELGGDNIFFHIKNYSKKHNRPEQGLSVFYGVSTDSSGRTCAVDVIPVARHTQSPKSTISLRRSIPAMLIVTLFFAVLYGLVTYNRVPPHTLSTYAVLSVFTFVMYAGDKSAAKSGSWRTSERSLHVFSLVGGWPGAALAQSMLRHKSKKVSFRIVYWMTVLINICILAWFALPKEIQQSIIRLIAQLK